MGKGRGQKMVKKNAMPQNFDIGKMFSDTMQKMQDLGSNMFKINHMNIEDFHKYIIRMCELCGEAAQADQRLLPYLEPVLLKMADLENACGYEELNKKYSDIRSDIFFTEFIKILSEVGSSTDEDHVF